MAAVKSRELSTDILLEWYRTMSLMRFFEDEAERCYQEGLIAGYHHVYSGQEAVAMGTFAHLGAKDHIITTYRDHGPALARGIGAKEVMAELHGKFTGTSKGKGGSMHLADRQLNFWGGYAIVAARDLENSALFQRVTSPDEDEKMPPAELGRQLTNQQIEILRRWIEEGAAWGKHWAFERIERPQPLHDQQ